MCCLTKNLEKASRHARLLQWLRKRYCHVDFFPLQGFQRNWEQISTFCRDWKATTTACLLHFDGDAASTVRWIGGLHTNAHLNVNILVLATLEPVIETDVFNDVKQILTLGEPAYCNSSDSEENFQEFKNHGNHKSVKENQSAVFKSIIIKQNQSVFKSTIIKQSKRGLSLFMDPAMINFSLNAHLTPQGLQEPPVHLPVVDNLAKD